MKQSGMPGVRGRRAWLAMHLCFASVITPVICGRSSAAEPQTVIHSDLTGAKGVHYEYAFLYDPDKNTLSWMEGGEELKTERHTSAELLASRRGKFGDSPAQIAYFDLALAAGGATMTYFRDPTAADIAKCESEHSAPDCKAGVHLAQFDEAGNCTFEEEAVK
jgi:hypothetical protein